MTSHHPYQKQFSLTFLSFSPFFLILFELTFLIKNVFVQVLVHKLSKQKMKRAKDIQKCQNPRVILLWEVSVTVNFEYMIIIVLSSWFVLILL